MADNKEALPVVAWMMCWTGHGVSVTTDPSDYPGERDQLIPLADHATAAAALSELRAEVERYKVDADRYRIWRANYCEAVANDESIPQVMIDLADAWTPDACDAILDAARSSSPVGAAQGSAEGGV